jgi:LysM repeat protein
MTSVRNHQQQLNGNNLIFYDMEKFLLFAILLLVAPNTFSQTAIKPGMNAIKHQIVSGETILSISKKYDVDPAEIYRANRFAIDGINEGMTLTFHAPQKGDEIEIKPERYVTNSKSKPTVVVPAAQKESRSEMPDPVKITNRGFHLVKPGETLYGLSKRYQVTVDAFKNANTILLENNLQAGQKLKIPDGMLIGKPKTETEAKTESSPQKVVPVANSSVSGEIIKHKVASKETLYGLAKKYNVTVDEIRAQNANIVTNGLQIGQIITIKIN